MIHQISCGLRHPASSAAGTGVPKSTIATWVSRQQPHNIEKHKQKSELKDVKKKLADAELKNKVLTELLKKTYQVWSND